MFGHDLYQSMCNSDHTALVSFWIFNVNNQLHAATFNLQFTSMSIQTLEREVLG